MANDSPDAWARTKAWNKKSKQNQINISNRLLDPNPYKRAPPFKRSKTYCVSTESCPNKLIFKGRNSKYYYITCTQPLNEGCPSKSFFPRSISLKEKMGMLQKQGKARRAGRPKKNE